MQGRIRRAVRRARVQSGASIHRPPSETIRHVRHRVIRRLLVGLGIVACLGVLALSVVNVRRAAARRVPGADPGVRAVPVPGAAGVPAAVPAARRRTSGCCGCCMVVCAVVFLVRFLPGTVALPRTADPAALQVPVPRTWNLELGLADPDVVVETIRAMPAGVVGARGADPRSRRCRSRPIRRSARMFPYQVLKPRGGSHGPRAAQLVAHRGRLDVQLRPADPVRDGHAGGGPAAGRGRRASAAGQVRSRVRSGCPRYDATVRDGAIGVAAADDRSASSRPARHCVLLGDFNVVDREVGYGELSAGLIDAQHAVGLGPGLTWRPPGARVAAVRAAAHRRGVQRAMAWCRSPSAPTARRAAATTASCTRRWSCRPGREHRSRRPRVIDAVDQRDRNQPATGARPTLSPDMIDRRARLQAAAARPRSRRDGGLGRLARLHRPHRGRRPGPVRALPAAQAGPPAGHRAAGADPDALHQHHLAGAGAGVPGRRGRWSCASGAWSAGTRWPWSCAPTPRRRASAATSPRTPPPRACTRWASTTSSGARTRRAWATRSSIQGHAAPGIYARAFLEGRLSEDQLDHFRQEVVPGQGLSSYPHPRLMPDFWEFPTVSMGIGPAVGDLPGALQPVPPQPGHQGHQRQPRLGIPGRRRDGRAGVAGRAVDRRAGGPRQPDLRRQLQPPAARRPGARQRQDRPGARVRLPGRRLERDQGHLGPRVGRAAGARHRRRAGPSHGRGARRRVAEVRGRVGRLHPASTSSAPTRGCWRSSRTRPTTRSRRSAAAATTTASCTPPIAPPSSTRADPPWSSPRPSRAGRSAPASRHATSPTRPRS